MGNCINVNNRSKVYNQKYQNKEVSLQPTQASKNYIQNSFQFEENQGQNFYELLQQEDINQYKQEIDQGEIEINFNSKQSFFFQNNNLNENFQTILNDKDMYEIKETEIEFDFKKHNIKCSKQNIINICLKVFVCLQLFYTCQYFEYKLPVCQINKVVQVFNTYKSQFVNQVTKAQQLIYIESLQTQEKKLWAKIKLNYVKLKFHKTFDQLIYTNFIIQIKNYQQRFLEVQLLTKAILELKPVLLTDNKQDQTDLIKQNLSLVKFINIYQQYWYLDNTQYDFDFIKSFIQQEKDDPHCDLQQIYNKVIGNTFFKNIQTNFETIFSIKQKTSLQQIYDFKKQNKCNNLEKAVYINKNKENLFSAFMIFIQLKEKNEIQQNFFMEKQELLDLQGQNQLFRKLIPNKLLTFYKQQEKENLENYQAIFY